MTEIRIVIAAIGVVFFAIMAARYGRVASWFFLGVFCAQIFDLAIEIYKYHAFEIQCAINASR